MKKILTVIIAVTLVLCSGCTKKPNRQEYNKPVTHEAFEDMNVLYASAQIKSYETEEELFDSVDMVFIGMPTATFTDGTARYFDLDGNEVTKDEKYFSSYTVRDIQVVEMLKGDSNTDTVRIAERGTVSKNKEGETIIAGALLPIAKQNVKYIYYVNYDKDMDCYVINADNGIICADGLDERLVKTVDSTRLEQVEKRFKTQFDKYDRTDEAA